MDKQTFETKLEAHVLNLVGDLKFSTTILERGQQLTDAIRTTVDMDANDWDEDMAVKYLETVDHETLFNGTKIEEGVAIAEENPSEEELKIILEQVTANISGLPNTVRTVIYTAGAVTHGVLVQRPA